MPEIVDLWLEFVALGPGYSDDPENDFFNASVTLDDGRRYGLNVWTFKYFETARLHDRRSGEHLGGEYLVAPDLFVEKLDRVVVERVFADLAAHDAFPHDCLVRDEDEADEGS